MSKLYLSCFLLLIAAPVLAQETSTPVLNKSNRIILHFKDTTGLFTRLARILIDSGYDIDMKDRELGILRTKPGPLRGGSSFTDQVEIKTIFRDSTITFSGVTYTTSSHDFIKYENKYEVSYSKRWIRNLMLSWEEMMRIAAQLQPAAITYSTVTTTMPNNNVYMYRRNN